MTSGLSQEERRELRRMADEPWYWLRKNFPAVKDWEDELFDLLDIIKAIWAECQQTRISLCFVLELDTVENPTTSLNVHDFGDLQKKQNLYNSTLAFVIDLWGSVIDEINVGQEIEPVSAKNLSQMREKVVFWLGSDFEIFCKGYPWDPRNKQEVLKDIKCKRRERLRSMKDYRAVLDAHYEQCIRDEARVLYWFPGKKNEVLRPTPERIFQRSLWDFSGQRGRLHR